MFRAKSWIQRAGVAAALLVSLCAGTTALPHAEGVDDFACSPIPVAHDENAHHIGAAPSAIESHAQHCFLCHSLRSVFPVFDKYEQRDSIVRAERLHVAPVAVASRLAWSLVLGRAPPV